MESMPYMFHYYGISKFGTCITTIGKTLNIHSYSPPTQGEQFGGVSRI